MRTGRGFRIFGWVCLALAGMALLWLATYAWIRPTSPGDILRDVASVIALGAFGASFVLRETQPAWATRCYAIGAGGLFVSLALSVL